jgi:hypothetical protein
VICVDFLPRDVTVSAQYFSKLLHSDLQQAIQNKLSGRRVIEEHPTAWQCLSTCIILDEDNISNN